MNTPKRQRTSYGLSKGANSTSKSSVAGVKRVSFRSKSFKKKGAKISSSMRAEIKKIVEASREEKINNKDRSNLLVNWVDSTSGISEDLSLNFLDEGTGINERVGQQINLKSAIYKFNLRASSTSNEVQEVLCVILKDRNAPAAGISNTNSDYKLNDNGGGTTIATATATADMLRPWNTLKYDVVFEEVFQLRAPASTGSSFKEYVGNTGDMTSYYRTIDLSKNYPKKIKYASDVTGGTPLYSVMWIPLTVITGAAATMPTVTSCMSFTYTDA